MSEPTLSERYSAVCSWWRSLGEQDKRRLLQELRISATYNSTKIENDRINIHDAQAILGDGSVINYTGPLRDLYEIDNHGRAWTIACDMAFGEFKGLDVPGLLHLQAVLTEHTYDADRCRAGERPGTFKAHDYGVGIDQEVGLPPEQCEDAVSSLLDEVNGYLGRSLSSTSSLTCATYLHAQLVDIHPFADGNGRTARLVQNMYLIAMDNLPIVQRAQDKMAYFGALDLFHAEGNLSGLEQLNQVETCLTWGSKQ